MSIREKVALNSVKITLWGDGIIDLGRRIFDEKFSEVVNTRR